MKIDDLKGIPELNENYQKASWLLKELGLRDSVDMKQITNEGMTSIASLVKESHMGAYSMGNSPSTTFIAILEIIRKEKINFVLQGLARDYGLGVSITMIELPEDNRYAKKVLELLLVGQSGDWDIRASADNIHNLFADFPKGIPN